VYLETLTLLLSFGECLYTFLKNNVILSIRKHFCALG